MFDDDAVHLFIPGPAGIDARVLEQAGAPLSAHYGPDFVALYDSCRERLREVFRTRNDLYLVIGPGTCALDAALSSALADGARVVVPVNGWFGARVAEMCRAHRAEVETIEFANDEPIDAARVIERLRREPRPTAVVWVHHETSAGVLNPVEPIARACREAGVLSIIDAVSSLGGTELDVDGWGVDLCVSVSNKGLASVPGIAPITVSEQAWKVIEANTRPRGWYSDLRTWRRYDREWRDWHPYPTTVASSTLAALHTSLGQILSEGLDERLRRTREAAGRVRQGLHDLGFRLLLAEEHACPVTTAAYSHDALPAAELIGTLRDRYRIYISGGLDELAGRIIRVGHMGSSIDSSEVELLLSAIGDVLGEQGAALPARAGVEETTA